MSKRNIVKPIIARARMLCASESLRTGEYQTDKENVADTAAQLLVAAVVTQRAAGMSLPDVVQFVTQVYLAIGGCPKELCAAAAASIVSVNIPKETV